MNQLSHIPAAEAAAPAPAPSATPTNPLLLLHGWLRGRYRLGIVLGALFAVPGAIVGYLAVPPMYTSTGLVHVAPYLPKILYETDDNQQLPLYDTFVSTQATLISSRRVADMAVADPDLRKAGWPTGPEGAAALLEAIDVQVPRRGTVITVTAENTDPRLAQAAVNAVLRAYMAVQAEMTGMESTSKEQALIERQQTLRRELDVVREQILQRAQEYGTAELQHLHAAKVDELIRIDAEIAALDRRAAQLAAAGQDDPGASGAGTDAPYEATLEELAAADPELGRLLEEERQIEARERAAEAQSLGPEHQTRKRLARQRDALRQQVNDRLAYLRQNPPPAAAGLLAGGLTAEAIAEMRARHVEMRERISAEALRIGRSQLAIAALRDQAADLQRSLDEASRELDRYRVERQNTAGGRVSISQQGDRPTLPSTDRRIPLAAFGALAGIGSGVGLVAAYGWWRRQYRYIDELDAPATGAPLLGCVPLLEEPDETQKELAARSIHHIRNVLDLSMPSVQGRGKCFVLTSGGPGDGKTNVTLALGMSFATAGRRTVIVDGDLVGRGLSHHLGLRDQVGLVEALRTGSVNGEVRQTGVPNLFAVSAGAQRDFQPENIDTPALQAVLAQLGEQFQVVLVDTGPLPGSLEANLLAPLADRVIVVVSRGQSPRIVTSVLDRIRRLGGVCAGTVFNRAAADDFVTSISTASLVSQPRGPGATSRGTIAVARVVGRVPNDAPHDQ